MTVPPPLRSWLYWASRRFLSLFLVTVGAIVLGAGFLLQGAPAQALQATITPPSPRLGDTIAVTVQTADALATPPTVTLRNQTYPTFAVGSNRYRALLPTTPLDKPGRLSLQITAGDRSQTLPVTLANRSFPTQRIWLPPGKGDDGTDLEFDRVDAFKKIVSPEKFWNGPFLRPEKGEITAGYGIRRYYNGVFAKDYYHRGVDYANGTGTPIVAPAAGRVALVGRESQGFKIHGNCIGLDHGQGVESIFLHLSRIDVKEGDFVKAGQVIGREGSTGAVTGPHLHWGLYVHGKSIDPTPWRNRGFN